MVAGARRREKHTPKTVLSNASHFPFPVGVRAPEFEQRFLFRPLVVSFLSSGQEGEKEIALSFRKLQTGESQRLMGTADIREAIVAQCFCLIPKSLPPAVSRRGRPGLHRRNAMVCTPHLTTKYMLHRVLIFI